MIRSLPVTVLVLVSLASSGFAAEQARYYAIKINNKLIGYAESRTSTVERDGRKLIKWDSVTSLKVALLGKERLTVLRSETLLDPKDQTPVEYRMTNTTNDLVQHVDCEFVAESVKTWTYRKGDDRGEPKISKQPAGALLLGANNFAHWNALMAHCADKGEKEPVKAPLFIPEAATATQFVLKRGKVEEISVAGAKRKCVAWSVAPSGMKVYADAETHAFVRLELSANDTVVELADESVVKLAQKARAEEMLAKHFKQSNVAFDDFLKVSSLDAKVQVKLIGSGVENTVDVLTTKNQEFEGEKKDAAVQGVVRVRTRTYAGEDSPAFPLESVDEDVAEWTKPSLLIESDHETIAAKSKELTAGAKTRWDAVLQVGQWVHKEIAYTIADSPSARLCLETKKGDCGPHSTLTVAMLRAANVPAKLVGGLVYTPSFGGSFGQHAWVEVYLGDAGWIAIDPTTGEFERLSATHIKLFEGMGGVIPESIKVTAFEPANKAVDVLEAAKPRPLAWKLDHPYTYRYLQGDKELGTETVTISEIEADGRKAYRLVSKLDLRVNFVTRITSESSMTVNAQARPIAFERTLSALLQKTKIKCDFKDGVVDAKISGSTTLEREVKLPPGTFCFDNNMMGSFMLICSQLELEANKPLRVRTFHPSSVQLIPLTMTPRPPAKIKIGEEELECFACEISPIKNTFWITRDGRFVRCQQGNLVIEVNE